MTGPHIRFNPAAYVHGDGSVVVVSARIAAILVRQAGLARYHLDHRGTDGELDAVLVALKVASAAYRSSLCGSEARKPAEPAAQSDWLTTTQVAEQLDVSDRRVRQLCASGSLEAEQIVGRWRIARTAFESYRAAHPAA